MRLLLVDGNAILYRSFFGMADTRLENSQGEPTGCLLAFIRTMIATIRVFDITHQFVAWDTKGKKTIRHKLYPDYKAKRKPREFDLSQDFKVTKEFLRATSIPMFSNPEYEADDIVGTLVKKYQDKAEFIIILGGDKDYSQLVSDKVNLYMFSTASKGFVTMGPDEVESKFGIPPELMVDYLALVGDKSDNLPGVMGCGKKTAVKLLKEYGSIREIYKNLEELTKSQRKKFLQSKKDAKLSYKLATIYDKIPLDIDEEDLRLDKMSYKGWKQMIDRMEFESLREEVDVLFQEFKFSNSPKSKENFAKLID